jgi:hypothetical protein
MRNKVNDILEKYINPRDYKLDMCTNEILSLLPKENNNIMTQLEKSKSLLWESLYSNVCEGKDNLRHSFRVTGKDDNKMKIKISKKELIVLINKMIYDKWGIKPYCPLVKSYQGVKLTINAITYYVQCLHRYKKKEILLIYRDIKIRTRE